VTKVIEVDFGLFRPPVALGPDVTHRIAVGAEPWLQPIGGGTPTMDGQQTMLAFFSDGKIARGTRHDVNFALRTCGQDPLWQQPL
jgi:hypothetical protein